MSFNNNNNNHLYHHSKRPNRGPLQQQTGCAFCKRNKEPESVYSSHQLKDSQGRVSCPQLFKYRCELCGSTGASAHTRSYCPLASSVRDLTNSARIELNNNNSDSIGPASRQNSAVSAYSNISYSTYSAPQPLQQQQQRQYSNHQERNCNSDDLQSASHFRGTSSIQVSNARLFRNMGSVSNSRYNSAGMRRDRHNDLRRR